MKRTISGILVIMMMLSIFSVYTGAEESDETVIQTVQLMEIMNGDEFGDMNLSANVTRAEFAKMMVSSSIYKDAAEGYGFSVFSDVRSEHWAAGYVKIAVQEGWFVGYLDGTFRPDNTITLEEGVTACLRLLGYTNLPGTYPNAQLAKYHELDLDEKVNATVGQPLSRRDCMYLFFNLLNAKTASGAIYASTLGYALNGNMELDTLNLVKDCTKGPYIAQTSGIKALPAAMGAQPTIYKNNKLVSTTDIQFHDVYYYNEEMRTVWSYNDRITGRLTDIDSLEAPTSIVVAGNTYRFACNEAAHLFSWAGAFTKGDMVTLLLGRDGEIAGAILAQESEEPKYGVVLSQTIISYTDASGKSQTENAVKVAMTDGSIQEYGVGKRTIAEKSIVSISFADGTTKIQSIRNRNISGKINSSGSKMGQHVFAHDIEIMDVNRETCQTIYPSRLAGTTLHVADVIYYSENSSGEIDTLILDDVTGDLYTYGFLTDAIETTTSSYMSGFYMYLIDGKRMTANLTNEQYNADEGGVMFIYDEGMLSGIKNLQHINISKVTDIWAKSGKDTFLIADEIQVYERVGDSYTLVPFSAVLDLELYYLTGYYDNFGFSAGEQIRVITATRK